MSWVPMEIRRELLLCSGRELRTWGYIKDRGGNGEGGRAAAMSCQVVMRIAHLATENCCNCLEAPMAYSGVQMLEFR
jgi:hypothetical protein